MWPEGPPMWQLPGGCATWCMAPWPLILILDLQMAASEGPRSTCRSSRSGTRLRGKQPNSRGATGMTAPPPCPAFVLYFHYSFYRLCTHILQHQLLSSVWAVCLNLLGLRSRSTGVGRLTLCVKIICIVPIVRHCLLHTLASCAWQKPALLV